MTQSRSEHHKISDFPHRSIISGFDENFWDVKFYPYVVDRADPPILAAVSYYSIIVYQVNPDSDGGLELLAWHHLDESHQRKEYWMNSCTWCYVEESDPLIAVTGESGQILIVKAITGELVSTLLGHGQGVVNDLATHPKYPWIIASASLDTSIRIWDLRRMNDIRLSACVVICGHGLAHKEGLLTVSWHDSGRHIVTGGFDYRIAVWTIPDLAPESRFWHEISKEGRHRSRDEVRVVYYPHFLSAAIHGDVVDTAVFVADLILSKAAKEEKIVLWSITGFNEDREPPDDSMTVKTQEHLETTNGFMQKTQINIDDDYFDPDNRQHDGPELYRRCLEFANPGSISFYVRFGLSKPSSLFPEVRLTLTAGNHVSELRHWDLQSYIDSNEIRKLGVEVPEKGVPGRPTVQPALMSANQGEEEPNARLILSQSRTQSQSVDDGHRSQHVSEAISGSRNKFPLRDPEKSLQAMQKQSFKSSIKDFTSRAVSWSACGKWCVAAGGQPDKGALILLGRK